MLKTSATTGVAWLTANKSNLSNLGLTTVSRDWLEMLHQGNSVKSTRAEQNLPLDEVSKEKNKEAIDGYYQQNRCLAWSSRSQLGESAETDLLAFSIRMWEQSPPFPISYGRQFYRINNSNHFGKQLTFQLFSRTPCFSICTCLLFSTFLVAEVADSMPPERPISIQKCIFNMLQ